MVTRAPRDLISAERGHRHEARPQQNAVRTAIHDDSRRLAIYVRTIRCCRRGLQTVLPCDSVCRRPGYLSLGSMIHSFQLRAYEQGTRARLSQVEDDLRVLRRERDDALRDLTEQTQVWVAEVEKWKSEVRSFVSLLALDSAYTRRRQREHQSR